MPHVITSDSRINMRADEMLHKATATELEIDQIDREETAPSIKDERAHRDVQTGVVNNGTSPVAMAQVDPVMMAVSTEDARTHRDGPTGLADNGTRPAAGADYEVEVAIIQGSNSHDHIVVNAAAVSAINADPYLHFANIVQAKDGDDFIIRDQTGGYELQNGVYQNMIIHGDDGDDTLVYAALESGITADFDYILSPDAGIVQQHKLNDALFDTPPFAADIFDEVENIIGTLHDDVIIGGAGANKFWGLDGDDAISGLGGSDTIWGGIGNDTINGGDHSDLLHGEDGNDFINGGASSDEIYGGDGADTLKGGSSHDLIFGGNDNDDIDGGQGNDTIHVGNGNDTVDGGAGSDTIHVYGNGDNVINGGGWKDTVIFDDNPVFLNMVTGEAIRTDGTDTIINVENIESGSGEDFIIGNMSANVIETGDGDDNVSGSGGDDIIKAGGDDDTINGDTGDDDLYGEFGNDWAYGGDGEDYINGGWGDDTLSGGDDDDNINGNRGEDDIRGGEGMDTLYGGDGLASDTFQWYSGDLGTDQIMDFQLNHDKLHFGNGFFAADPDGTFNISEVLFVGDIGDDTSLWAQTADDGLQFIAILYDVDSEALEQKINNGTIFDVQLNDMLPIDPGFGVMDVGFELDGM